RHHIHCQELSAPDTTPVGKGNVLATIASSHVDRPAPDRLRPVRIWLYCIAALTLVMVAVGGITRLTGSGLSITEWAPISGILPPLTQADWEAQFEAYKQIPQYQLQNYG